jgi:ribosomal protein S18 acetylase RimI-like enzyme
MTKEQYEQFISVSTDRQIDDQVLAGRLDPSQARDIITAQLGRMLPHGVETPGHEFFAIESAETGEQVGDLWFTTMKRAGHEVGFVMDIQIHEKHRRHGYGTATFGAIERLATEKGLDEVTLSVAGHNTPARALYEKLGYREVNVSMAKKLGR